MTHTEEDERGFDGLRVEIGERAWRALLTENAGIFEWFDEMGLAP